MDRIIDLRSDTVTKPTDEMYRAMANAEVGDDVFKEDPSVIRLEEYTAEIMGKEAALFLPSGTMSNLVAIMSHTPLRKSEIIAESHSHIVRNEAGGYAHVAHAALVTVDGERGAMDPAKVESLIRDPENVHSPRTALICMENTHNAAGGAVIPTENMIRVGQVAKSNGVAMHLDGARIFNAAHALKIQAGEIANSFDSVSVCLSKGLSAPVGSVLTGNREFIRTANAMRKILGGGMRQCGVIAAAGYIAITRMVDRLAEDHETARIIGEALCEIRGISLDAGTVQTNMVKFDVSGLGTTAREFIERLRLNGVLALSQGEYTVRFVTHRHISRTDAFEAAKRVSDTVENI